MLSQFLVYANKDPQKTNRVYSNRFCFCYEQVFRVFPYTVLYVPCVSGGGQTCLDLCAKACLRLFKNCSGLVIDFSGTLFLICLVLLHNFSGPFHYFFQYLFIIVSILFRTCSRLLQYSFSTCSVFFQYLSRTVSGLVQDFFRTFAGLVQDLFRTC